ncbi:MAG: calcium/sodium antiporter [Verrucomicrobiia bacterium]
MAITLMLLAGLVALYFGAEWLVHGGASLAVRLGLTPLMVGLTVVAYGTAMPELIVSSTAALQGNGAIAVGNVIGSNILNIGLILGLTALICPLRVQFQLVKWDTPIMVGVAVLFLLFYLDLRIVLWESLVFLGGILVYTVFIVVVARRQASEPVHQAFIESRPKPTGGLWKDSLLIVAGLAVLVVGSRWFVAGAVELAKQLGVSDAIIGLTIVSAGTSLPELASSLMAALRKQPDIAVGNIVGSNIYNILAILGVSGAIQRPLEGQGVGLTETGIMVGMSGLLLVVAWTGFKLRRWEGGLLLVLYGGYLWYLWPKG